MHALGIENDPEYISLVPKFVEGVHADPEFVEFMIKNKFISERKRPSSNLLAVYASGGRVQHIGRLISKSRVVSKWGAHGHLYEHALLEVPLNYGDELRFYTSPTSNIVVEHFAKYAASKGTHFVEVHQRS